MSFFSDLKDAISSIGGGGSSSRDRGRIGGLRGTSRGPDYQSISLAALPVAQALGRGDKGGLTLEQANRQVRSNERAAASERQRKTALTSIQEQASSRGDKGGGERSRTPAQRVQAPSGTATNISSRIQSIGAGKAVAERIAPTSTPSTGQRRAASAYTRRVGSSGQSSRFLVPIAQTSRALKALTGI